MPILGLPVTTIMPQVICTWLRTARTMQFQADG